MWRPLIACLIALFPFLLDGINDGYSSNILHQRNTISFQIDFNALSWIASASVISMPIASLYCGPLMHIYGRKKVLQFLCLLALLGWLIILTAQSVISICVGRFLNGLAVGMQIASVMYISEISDSPKFRAFSLSLLNPAIGLGTAICYTIGYLLTAQQYSLAICCLTLVFFLLTFFIPESPVWLLMNNDLEKAAKAEKWLQKAPTNEKGSLEEHPFNGPKLPLMERIKATKSWKPLIHLTVFFILQILTGNPVFIYYASDIYESLNVPLDSSLSAVILATIQFCTLIGVSCSVDKLDRRTWTKISSVGVLCSYMVMGISEYLSYSIVPRPTLWLPLICSWVAAICSSVGLYSMPWILLGELFPTSTKDFMGGLQMTIICILQFLAVKTYPLLNCMLHIYNLCLIFSVGGFLSYIYSQFFMPETRGKTLAEIEGGWI